MTAPPEPKLAFRMKLYQDPYVRTLLSAVVSGDIPGISPFPDVVFKSRYPSVEKKLNIPPEHVDALLEQLADAGILNRELFSIINTCPSCGSFRLIVHPLCALCKSRNLSRSEVYEHLACGYVGLEQTFWREGRHVCPRCNKELQKLGVDHRIVGIYYQCRDCKKSFDVPTFQCGCQECNGTFFLTDATFLNLYTYSLNESFREEILRHVVSLEPIKKAIEAMGLTVETPGYVTGASGVQQRFDVVARYPGPTVRYVVMDIVLSEAEVAAENVLSLFARSVDVKPEETALIAIPKLRDDAKPLLPVYKIKCIEGKTVEETVPQIEKLIRPS